MKELNNRQVRGNGRNNLTKIDKANKQVILQPTLNYPAIKYYPAIKCFLYYSSMLLTF